MVSNSPSGRPLGKNVVPVAAALAVLMAAGCGAQLRNVVEVQSDSTTGAALPKGAENAPKTEREQLEENYQALEQRIIELKGRLKQLERMHRSKGAELDVVEMVELNHLRHYIPLMETKLRLLGNQLKGLDALDKVDPPLPPDDDGSLWPNQDGKWGE